MQSHTGFPKTRGTFLGLLIIRIIVFWVYVGVPLVGGKYYIPKSAYKRCIREAIERGSRLSFAQGILGVVLPFAASVTLSEAEDTGM